MNINTINNYTQIKKSNTRYRALNLKLVKYITCQLVLVFLVLILPTNAKGTTCVLTQDHSYTSGTLNMDFNLGLSTPATWNVYLSVANVAVPLFSIPLPTIDPPISAPLSIPGFPDLGGIGVLTTLTTPVNGIICSDWLTVDISSPVNPILFKFPDTGQTQDFTPTFGEDSDYTINPPSYTDNGDGTVTDNNTGLMWQQEDDDIQRTWDEAVSYSEGLSLAGHTDWRLPDVKELKNIVSLGNYNPAIDRTYFPNTNSSYYWSFTTLVGYPSGAWLVYFYDGYVVNYYKWDSYYVRCVRGGTNTADFIDNGDGTVTDNVTDLMWQQEDDDIERNWDDAITYCEAFSLAGHDDWRLPNYKELSSIIDYNLFSPAIDGTYFLDTNSERYWSSTACMSCPYSAWDVNFSYGLISKYDKLGNYYVRCVQGGQ